jgi:transposase
LQADLLSKRRFRRVSPDSYELAIRFGVILRKVWGGSRTWAGARAQSVLMSVWRTCWQQGRSALDFLSQLLRGTPVALALPS